MNGKYDGVCILKDVLNYVISETYEDHTNI